MPDFVYIIILVAVAIGIAISTKILKKKGIIDNDDLLAIAKAFDLSLKVVAELNLNKEKEILYLGQVVYEAVDFALTISDNLDNMVDSAIEYIEDQCREFGIELTENRRSIVVTLVTIGLSNRLEY